VMMMMMMMMMNRCRQLIEMTDCCSWQDSTAITADTTAADAETTGTSADPGSAESHR